MRDTAIRYLTVLASALVPGTLVAQDSAIEHEVKATYVYKFAPFVEWPPGAFASATSAVVICVMGNDETGKLVADAARGQSAGERPIDVRYVTQAMSMRECHIVYIGVRESERRKAIAERLQGAPVLTITDVPADAPDEGIINFVLQDNRVRFEIDLDAAARNQLVISSKLLRLATKVRPKS
jgi:uncharacterized protein DUF4154